MKSQTPSAESRSFANLRVVLVLASVVVALFAVTGVTQASGTFAPTISLETSTTRATAHPDARITIDNSASSENIKDLTLSLPDGFWGSLGAVPYKCSESDAIAGTCQDETKIGTVTASADIEDPDTGTMVDGVLSGNVYLTDAFTGNNDPAGVSILVHAKVGGVDLGKVIINGRAVARMVLPTGFDPSAAKDVVGLDTIVNDIPQSITDTNSRTVGYKVDRMQIDLLSDLQNPSDPDPNWGYLPPLLTNPSRCGDYQISATATPYGGGSDVTFSDGYTVDQCNTAHFDPQVSNNITSDPDFQTPSDPIPTSSTQGVVSNISFPAATDQPDSNSALSEIKITMPRGLGANYNAFGSGKWCDGSQFGRVSDNSSPNYGRYFFKPAGCPAAAKVGEAYLYTPLMPPGQPLTGYVYLANSGGVLPGLVIAVTDDIGGNLPGVNLYLVGLSDLQATDSSSTTGESSRVIVTFKNLPDTPITSAVVDLDKGPRDGGVSGNLLQMADQGTVNCQPVGDMTTELQSISGASRAAVQSYNTACPGATITPTTGPWGQSTTDTTPTFDFNYSGASAYLWCGIGTVKSNRTDCKPSPHTITAPTQTSGAHSVIVADNGGPTGSTASVGAGKSIARDFVVQPDLDYDSTVPTTTLSAGPGSGGPTGTTSDSTPTFSFNSSETSTFQCSIDGGAFLPCGSASGTATTDYTIPDDPNTSIDDLPASDTIHTFAVRAQDTAGNVDLTPAEASFKVVKPFAPTLDVDLTTSEARKHPEMTVTIDNPSHEDIKDFQLNLPDGFFGGLTGVQSLCSADDANHGLCTAGSQVGTVEATALIDRSTAHITGKAYLTEPQPANAGDPAGLTVEVNPKLQGVEFKPIRINARLMVRGEAQGINTAAIDIPDTAETTLNEVSEFDVHQLVIKLKNNNLAPKPLLTNPSACDAKAFDATFTGYDSTTDTASVPFQATNCGALSFAPQISIKAIERSTGGPPGASTNIRRAAVDLSASAVADPDGAGIKAVNLTLPRALTIDAQLLPSPCQPDQQAAKLCPESSKIGTVSAVSPLLNETLSGNIYVLKPTTGLPRLLLALRGRINVDIVANNRFSGPNFDHIQTTFENLPDAPISSFSMQVNGFLTTRPDACAAATSDWNYVGTLGGYNGASSPVNLPASFDCAAVTLRTSSWKPKKAKSTLSTVATAQLGNKFKSLSIKLPKGVSFIKSGFSKKKIAKLVTVKAGSSKLKTKCFKLKGTNTLVINFCGKKTATSVTASFKAGTITTKSKSKKIKLTGSATGANGAKLTVTPVS